MKRSLGAVLCLPGAIVLAHCAAGPVVKPAPPTAPPAFPPGYVAAWETAVVDARNPTPEEIDPELTPIAGNPELIRKSIDGEVVRLATRTT